jgi:hypothetical protein
MNPCSSDSSVTPFNMFNMQYQQLINDSQRYSNFNNNNDQRKFVINYVTVNNYYGAPPSVAPKIEDIIKDSGFSNPPSNLGFYRK